MIFWFRLGKVVEDRLDHGGSEFLRGKAVTSTHHLKIGPALFVDGLDAIEQQRLATRPWFFGAVKHSQGLRHGRKRSHETARIERPVEPYLEYAHFFTAGVQVVDGLVNRFTTRSHQNDDPLRVRRAVIFIKR